MQKIQNICTLLFKYKRKLNYAFNSRCYSSHVADSATKDSKYNIVFFGTDSFSLRSLVLLDKSRKCSSSRINNIHVVTSFKGHANPIKKYATENQLECTDWLTQSFATQQSKFDLGVVVSFGHLIPEKVINMFPMGMLNVHASLLPKWRGASPIIYTILNEDPVTGVSIMKIHPNKFDVGEILAQREVLVPKNVLMPHLHRTLSNEGAQLLLECIENLPQRLQNAHKQSEENVTFAPKVPEAMAHISWNEMSARYIQNLYRALYSFKWLSTTWHDRRIKIREIVIPDDDEQSINTGSESKGNRPGSADYDKATKTLHVQCIDGRSIQIKQLGIEGKRSMSAEDFNNGFLKKVDKNFRYFL